MSQKYAAYDKSGAITGFYDSVDSPVPSGTTAIEITDAQWQTCLSTPGYSVVNGVLTPPSAATLLEQAQTAQIAALRDAYEAAILAPISFKTAAGTTAMFATTPAAIGYLQGVIAAGGAAWTANLWLSNAGAPITPFTFADVQGLAAAIEAVETPEYQELLKLIGEVMAATTVSAVHGVIWA